MNDWNEGTSTDYTAYLIVDEEGCILSIDELYKQKLLANDATGVNYEPCDWDEFDYEDLEEHIEQILLEDD